MRSPLHFFLASIAISVLLGMTIDPAVVPAKLVDALTIAFGAIGIFPAALESSRVVPRNRLTVRRGQLENKLRFLEYKANGLPKLICRKFVKSKYTTADFDAEQEQHDEACPYATQIRDYFTRLDPDQLPAIDLTIFELPDTITDRFIRERFRELATDVASYERSRQEVGALLKEISKHDVEDLVNLFSPYCFSIAVALAIFGLF